MISIVLSIEDRVSILEDLLGHQRVLLEEQSKIIEDQGRRYDRLQISMVAAASLIAAGGECFSSPTLSP